MWVVAWRSGAKGAPDGRRGRLGALGRAVEQRSGGELPALDTLHDLPAFTDLRVDDAQRGAFEAFREASEAPDEMDLGFVIRLDRGFPLVATVDDVFPRRARRDVRQAGQGEGTGGLLPAIGDAVAVRRAPGHDMGVIERVLPRRTTFERWRGKNRGVRQVLCANVDTVLVVAALGAGEVLLDRIARSLVLARDCGAAPWWCHQGGPLRGRGAGARAGARAAARWDAVRVIATSSRVGEGVEQVRACVPERACAMILGESGAGKSTLLNALLGHEALATGAVRVRDDSGRHTTVARVMVKLPGAGVIADAPGLRSLPLVGHERGLARTFPEVVEASRGCRFNDCTHTHEPGCAVRAAVETGAIDEVRLDAFLNLAEEMRVSAQSLDPDIKL